MKTKLIALAFMAAAFGTVANAQGTTSALVVQESASDASDKMRNEVRADLADARSDARQESRSQKQESRERMRMADVKSKPAQ
jgi:hypothetical protein